MKLVGQCSGVLSARSSEPLRFGARSASPRPGMQGRLPLRDTSQARHSQAAQAKKPGMQSFDEMEAAEQAEPLITQSAQPGNSLLKGRQALFGQLSLFGCALLWGTSPPAMRYLYLQGPGQAPHPSVVAAVQTTGAAVCLAALEIVSQQLSASSTSNRQTTPDSTSSSSNGESAAAVAEPASAAWPLNLLFTATETNVNAAAFEIGLWAFAANCLTVTGFENTTTSRGAFLIRLSAVFTPVVAAAVGEQVPLPVWLGCLAAFAGGVLITADSGSSQAEASQILNLSLGDGYIIIAAMLWSIQTVRMGKHAPKFKPVTLAKFQLATMALFSTAWLAQDAFTNSSQGSNLGSLWGGYGDILNWGVLLIPAVGPWSIGVALQAKGQASVPSSLAMIIFATDPLWAILFAGLVGGNEQHLGSYGLIGAGCILSASVIASLGKKGS